MTFDNPIYLVDNFLKRRYHLTIRTNISSSPEEKKIVISILEIFIIDESLPTLLFKIVKQQSSYSLTGSDKKKNDCLKHFY